MIYLQLQHCCVNFFEIMKLTRNTAAKTEIQNLFETSNTALSHADIQLALDGLCDRVTIYRILDRLIAEDVIHKIVNIDGGVKYASCNHKNDMHNHNHVHFSCTNCQTLICLEDVAPTFKLPKKYKVESVHCTIAGICAACM